MSSIRHRNLPPSLWLKFEKLFTRRIFPFRELTLSQRAQFCCFLGVELGSSWHMQLEYPKMGLFVTTNSKQVWRCFRLPLRIQKVYQYNKRENNFQVAKPNSFIISENSSPLRQYWMKGLILLTISSSIEFTSNRTVLIQYILMRHSFC